MIVEADAGELFVETDPGGPGPRRPRSAPQPGTPLTDMRRLLAILRAADEGAAVSRWLRSDALAERRNALAGQIVERGRPPVVASTSARIGRLTSGPHPAVQSVSAACRVRPARWFARACPAPSIEAAVRRGGSGCAARAAPGPEIRLLPVTRRVTRRPRSAWSGRCGRALSEVSRRDQRGCGRRRETARAVADGVSTAMAVSCTPSTS